MMTDRPGDYEPKKHFMSKQIQVSQLLATPDATYVNGEVTGYLTQIRPPNGRGPSKARLHDSSGQIEVSLWGGGVSHWEGKQVTFSGKGMQIKEFKGVKGLSVGDKVLISQAAQQADEMPGDPPAAPQTRPAPEQARSVPQKPFPALPDPFRDAPVNLPHGATVGGALARAVDIYLAMGQAADTGVRWDTPDIAFVEQITRDLVEIQGRIERGEPPATP